MTDSRDLIQRLADTVEDYCVINDGRDYLSPLVAEARAYLAQPKPERPTLAEDVDLPPEAQAVLDAYEGEDTYNFPLDGIAAALEALADQVVPWKPEPTEDSVGPTIDFGYAWALFSKANDIRQEILAIADELRQ